MALLLLVPTAAVSKNGKGKNDGSTTGVIVDYGDVFGDLIHILRFTDGDGIDTGQPIFAQRWVEMPAELPGFGWGYCAIGLDEHGVEIPFLPYSCDLDTTVAEPIEVDYFGRLNASRVQERNQRLHFNETINNIKQADMLKPDPTGRLMLGFECVIEGNPDTCSWTTVDSPMENMALYRRMMKYGHLSTSPTELDLWWHGDPKLPTPYHPALDADDFQKFFDAGLYNMLPDKTCWVGSDFVNSCADPEYLTPEDFDSSAELLGSSASKFGFITGDLVQYLNRFLKITQTTLFAASTKATLQAMYRDCYDGDDPWKSGEEAPEDYNLLDDLSYGTCEIKEVDSETPSSTPNYLDFPNIQELFMDFGQSAYVRSGDGGIGGIWDERTAPVALEATLSISIVIDPESTTPRVQEATPTPIATSNPGANSDIWKTVNTDLLDWIEIANDYSPAEMNIHNFVDAASDALRAIEFFHNYEVPENLYCTYSPDYYSCDDLADSNE